MVISKHNKKKSPKKRLLDKSNFSSNDYDPYSIPKNPVNSNLPTPEPPEPAAHKSADPDRADNTQEKIDIKHAPRETPYSKSQAQLRKPTTVEKVVKKLPQPLQNAYYNARDVKDLRNAQIKFAKDHRIFMDSQVFGKFWLDGKHYIVVDVGDKVSVANAIREIYAFKRKQQAQIVRASTQELKEIDEHGRKGKNAIGRVIEHVNPDALAVFDSSRKKSGKSGFEVIRRNGKYVLVPKDEEDDDDDIDDELGHILGYKQSKSSSKKGIRLQSGTSDERLSRAAKVSKFLVGRKQNYKSRKKSRSRK